MLPAEHHETASLEQPADAPALLLEFLDATRSSLWVLDPERLQRLRSCVDDARRWGEIAALEQFWVDHRIAEDAAIHLNWFDVEIALGLPLQPEPPFMLACACTGVRLDATQQHAALPPGRPGRLDLLFDRSRPACHRWVERRLDRLWHASFVSAREVLRQLPARLDDACRASLTDWLYERRRAEGEAPDPTEAAELFEVWARRYAGQWRGDVVAELTPLAARDAQLVVFTDD